MFELISPLYLYIAGSIGVMIPLVLHLIQNSRTVKVPFSTIRFLQLAQKKSSQKIKMQNILLWLIRTLLLLALALAFAMPMLRNRSLGAWVGRSARDVAIVIDGSYSMDYNLGRSTTWKKAIDSAVTLLEGLNEQDRFCIYVARDHVDPLIEQLSSDREEAISRLKALEFSQTSSQLGPAIMEANQALDEASGRREREIHVLTDSQLLPWKDIGEGESVATEPPAESSPKPDSDESTAAVSAMNSWDPGKIDKRTVCFVTLLGAQAPENVAVADVEVEPSLVMANAPSRVKATLVFNGPARNTALTLFVDDREISSRSTLVGGDEAEDLTFLVPPLSQGRHAARIELPDDNLAIDNTFNFILKAEDQLPTLLIGGDEDVFFLKAALGVELDGRAVIKADVVAPDAIPVERLNNYASIFACNAIPLAANEVEALRKYVDGGGMLALFPGDRGAAADYGALNFLPGVPSGIHPVSSADPKRVMAWEKPQHMILAGLGEASSAPPLSVKQHLIWDTLETKAERLISAGNEVFLVGGSFGRGYVLMCAVSANRAWSDFPLSPYFLPIMHQAVRFGAGVGYNAPYVWCTKRLPLETYLPEATPEQSLIAPDNSRLPIRSAKVQGQMILHVEDITTAGLYQLSGTSGQAEPGLAVNMSREEADLSPVDPASIQERMGLDKVYVSADQEELNRNIEDSRIGRTFGEQLLWLALLLAAIEFFYANRLLKTAPALSETLNIDASGKVSAVEGAA